ncbi:MAG: hypothetical protein AABY33_02785 [Pseudomonadota bacterium]
MNIFKRLFELLFKRKRKKHYLPPEQLPQEAMAQVMREVSFLRSEHAVDVRELEAGEKPGIPKKAE